MKNVNNIGPARKTIMATGTLEYTSNDRKGDDLRNSTEWFIYSVNGKTLKVVDGTPIKDVRVYVYCNDEFRGGFPVTDWDGSLDVPADIRGVIDAIVKRLNRRIAS